MLEPLDLPDVGARSRFWSSERAGDWKLENTLMEDLGKIAVTLKESNTIVNAAKAGR